MRYRGGSSRSGGALDMGRQGSLTYKDAGVDSEQQDRAMPLLTNWIEKTFQFRQLGNPIVLPLGYFANVVDLGNGLGLALSTDGVGTKAIIAQLLGKFDTIGIDCVAMNVNDVICVGAEPVALLDYIAVESANPSMLEAMALGLYRGAEMAGVSIPGGEIAQVPEMLHKTGSGTGFDLVGTCVGSVPLNRVLTGRNVQEGDVIIGLRSSGVHSNGLTLARKIFFGDQEARGLGWATDRFVDELGRTIGEELLEPTRIYVKEVLSVLRAGIQVKALAHITSTGFMNLSRAEAGAGYVLDNLPPPQPIFALIQEHGRVSDSEMYNTYNMGIGFCIVLAPGDAERALTICKEHGTQCQVIGRATRDTEKRVVIPSKGLVGTDGGFVVSPSP